MPVRVSGRWNGNWQGCRDAGDCRDPPAFGLAPRINAAGTGWAMSMTALELLLCEDEGTAREKAEILCGYNDQRKKIEAEILAEVAAKITADPSLVQERVIVMDGAAGIMA